MRTHVFLLVLCAFAACNRNKAPPPPPAPVAAVADGTSIPVSAVQREIDRLRRGAGTPVLAHDLEAPPQVDAKDGPRLRSPLLDPPLDPPLPGLPAQSDRGSALGTRAKAQGRAPAARRGGALGWSAPGPMPKVFDGPCFPLKPGQVSGFVQSRPGSHPFKWPGSRPPKKRSLGE